MIIIGDLIRVEVRPSTSLGGAWVQFIHSIPDDGWHARKPVQMSAERLNQLHLQLVRLGYVVVPVWRIHTDDLYLIYVEG